MLGRKLPNLPRSFEQEPVGGPIAVGTVQDGKLRREAAVERVQIALGVLEAEQAVCKVDLDVVGADPVEPATVIQADVVAGFVGSAGPRGGLEREQDALLAGGGLPGPPPPAPAKVDGPLAPVKHPGRTTP